ncbi:hypothetical protein XF30_17190 [Bradyrhizobium sp. SUTN9-2]|nr:hypothetical protein XF30_17190 [Bradyrhizobium sp. SUTN9-2]
MFGHGKNGGRILDGGLCRVRDRCDNDNQLLNPDLHLENHVSVKADAETLGNIASKSHERFLAAHETGFSSRSSGIADEKAIAQTRDFDADH